MTAWHPLEAMALLEHAQKALPNDAHLKQLEERYTLTTSITSGAYRGDGRNSGLHPASQPMEDARDDSAHECSHSNGAISCSLEDREAGCG